MALAGDESKERNERARSRLTPVEWAAMLVAVSATIVPWVWPVTASVAVWTLVFPTLVLLTRLFKKVRAVEGLTLVFVVTALMAAWIRPGLLQNRECARKAVCAANLHGIGTALRLYEGRYEGAMPPDMEVLVTEDILGRKTFKCPSTSIEWTDGTPLDACYLFHLPADLHVEGRTPSVIACDRVAHEGEYRNVLMSDNSVQGYNVEEFRALLARPENAEFAEVFRREVGEP